MKLNTIRRLLYVFGKFLGDYNAVKKGKIKRRIGVRISGKLTGKGLRKLFK